jgi:hypothetical protein
MSKNNLKQLLIRLVITMLFAVPCHSQSIGELVESARLRQLREQPVMLPPASDLNTNEVQTQSSPNASAVNSGAMIVTSIFTSKDKNQTGISIGGVEVYVGPGDTVINNWVVDSISTNTVVLKRCMASKRCEIKKLNYTLTQ